MLDLPRPFPQRLGKWLILGICAALTATVWVSYRAATEWQRAATDLARKRAESAVDLLVTALSRDMRGVQASLLSYPLPDELLPTSLSDPADVIASAFARYPYPEVFFAWGSTASPSAVVFYSRAARYPSWIGRDDGTDDLYPVVVGSEPTSGRRLLDRVALDAALGRRYSVFDITMGTSTYQVVSLLYYRDSFREQLRAVFGFMVDLAWVRRHYLQELTTQVARISAAGGVDLSIQDARGEPIVGARSPGGGIAARRQVPVLFFDPRLVAVQWPDDLANEIWTTQAVVSADPSLRAANLGARSTLAIAVGSAAVLAAGLLLIVQAARAKVRLADMRSEFVSTVTHELKTPIATIQAISETFASDRGVTPELSRKYGRLALHEAKRLRRLIDNLLAYARITDVTEMYSFEPVAPHRLAEEAVRDFASQLEYGKFEIMVDVPAGLPKVRADRRAMRLALGNLVDNAIRYSQQSRYLTVTGYRNGTDVVMVVTDRGMGIPEKELPYITQKFFRGRHSDVSGGSGLGLAIVDRIVADHGGALELCSTVGVGTTVKLTLPIAEECREEALAAG